MVDPRNGNREDFIINEPYGAEASLKILKTLVTSGSTSVEEALSEMTIMIIPSLNPDGRELNQRRTVGGVDLNRDWGDPILREQIQNAWGFPYKPYAAWQAIESENSWYAWAEFKPHYLIDIHHQGIYYVDDDTNATSHISLGKSGAYAGGGDAFYATFVDPDVLAAARQMTMVGYDALLKLGNVNPTLYPVGVTDPTKSPKVPGSPGGASELGCRGPLGEDAEWASAALLIELRGSIGQKSCGKIINMASVAVWAIIDSIASGEIAEVDPDRVYDIPNRGDRISTSDKFPNWPED